MDLISHFNRNSRNRDGIIPAKTLPVELKGVENAEWKEGKHEKLLGSTGLDHRAIQL